MNSKLTDAEAAQMLGIKKSTLTVWRCTKRNIIPYYKIGKNILYDIKDLDDFIESKRVGVK